MFLFFSARDGDEWWVGFLISFHHHDVLVVSVVRDVHIGISFIRFGELWWTHVSFMALFGGHFHGFSFRGWGPALPIP